MSASRTLGRSAAWLRRRWLGVSLAALMLYVFPYFPGIRSANELPRVYLVQAIADRGTFAIDDGVERHGATADVSCAGAAPGTSLARCRAAGGHFYSNKAPGSSFLAVPAYLALRAVTGVFGREPTLAEVTWVCRVVTGVVPTLLFLGLLAGFLRRFSPERSVQRMVLVAYALGSMALPYSVLFISHQLSAVCIAAAWILLVQALDGERGPRALWAAGVLAGCAPLCDYQAAFAGVPIAAWLGYRLWRRDDRLAVLARLALGAAGPLAALLAYHAACFGGPLRTGYDASTTFAHFHQAGFLGITELRLEAFIGSTVAGDNGLVTFAPWLLLALPGLWWMARAGARGHAIVIGAIAVLYLLFISSINFWRGGWQLGPRYITAMLPFLLPPVAVALSRVDGRAWARGVAWGAIAVGVVVYAGSVGVFPHFPEKFGNPLHDLVLRLVLDGHAAPNAWTLVDLRGAWTLAPYLLGVGAVFVAVALDAPGTRRSRLLSLGLAGVVALAVLAAYRAFPSGGASAEAYRWVVTTMPR